MLGSNFCAVGFEEQSRRWWTTKDPFGAWIVVCDDHYDGPRNRPYTRTFPTRWCQNCGELRSQRWYRVGGQNFPPMPDRIICHRCVS